jgi:hypothetical protein
MPPRHQLILRGVTILPIWDRQHEYVREAPPPHRVALQGHQRGAPAAAQQVGHAKGLYEGLTK